MVMRVEDGSGQLCVLTQKLMAHELQSILTILTVLLLLDSLLLLATHEQKDDSARAEDGQKSHERHRRDLELGPLETRTHVCQGHLQSMARIQYPLVHLARVFPYCRLLCCSAGGLGGGKKV